LQLSGQYEPKAGATEDELDRERVGLAPASSRLHVAPDGGSAPPVRMAPMPLSAGQR
jgi:hypothetical protein